MSTYHCWENWVFESLSILSEHMVHISPLRHLVPWELVSISMTSCPLIIADINRHIHPHALRNVILPRLSAPCLEGTMQEWRSRVSGTKKELSDRLVAQNIVKWVARMHRRFELFFKWDISNKKSQWHLDLLHSVSLPGSFVTRSTASSHVKAYLLGDLLPLGTKKTRRWLHR